MITRLVSRLAQGLFVLAPAFGAGGVIFLFRHYPAAHEQAELLYLGGGLALIAAGEALNVRSRLLAAAAGCVIGLGLML